jgi:hypothetical protein
MRPKVRALAAAAMIVFAVSGASAQKNKTVPNGKPFQALQTQIDALESRVDGVEDSIGTLDARWRETEARLDEQAGSLRALLDADEALQALVRALRQDSAAHAAELEALRLELNEKQALIIQACAPGSSIRQVDASGTVQCDVDDEGTGGGGAPIAIADFDSDNQSVPALGSKSVQKFCPSGYRAISGGYIKPVAATVSIDSPDGNGWRVVFQNPTAAALTVRVVVRCITP